MCTVRATTAESGVGFRPIDLVTNFIKITPNCADYLQYRNLGINNKQEKASRNMKNIRNIYSRVKVH